MEKLVIAGREFNSRLFLGTGKFNNNQLMAEAIKASETEMVTVAMKRIELEDKHTRGGEAAGRGCLEEALQRVLCEVPGDGGAVGPLPLG